MNTIQRLNQLAANIPDVVELSLNTRQAVQIGAGVVGAAALGVAGVRTVHSLRRQKEWARNAGPNDVLKIAHDVYIDKHGAMMPGNHPRVQNGKIHDLG